jgi:phage-related protein
MAGPSVVVRVLGDVTGLAKSFGTAVSKGSDAAKGLHNAFQGVLATLNSSGVLGPFGEALATVDESLEKIKGHAKDIGPAMMGVGGALAGIGLAFTAMGSKDQAAHQQLQASVGATGRSYEDYAKKIEEAVKTQERYGHTANDTQDALRLLTQATGDPAKALNLIATASDLAASKHEDLATAAGQLGKAYNGSTKILKEFGLTAAPKAAAATKALDAATRAATSADDAAAKAKQQLADLQARFGVSNRATVVSTAGVTAAQDRLRAAEQRLADVRARQAGKSKLTINDQIALRNAQQSVTAAQAKLTAATAAHSAAQDKANAKTGLTVAQQQQLRNAQQRVTDATGKAIEAHKKMTDAQLLASKAAKGQDNNMTALSQKLKGQASAAADTFGGHIKAIKAHLEDAAATMGQKYGPAVSAVGAIMAGMGGAVTAATGVFKSLQGVMKTQQAVTEGVTVAEDAEAASSWLALGPLLLIIAAVAALVAIGYVIYRNWSTIWGAIKKAVKAVWDWIKDNWPLLVGILLGPIGIAAALIYKYWDTVKKDAKAVIDFIIRIWNDLVGFFTAIPAALSQAASGLWDFITDQAKTVYKDVVGVWNGLVRWLTGLPGAVLRTLSGLWNFIYNEASTVDGWVIGVWNAMIRWLTGLPGAVLRTLSGLWNFIYNEASTVDGWVVGVWNGLVRWLTGLPSAIARTVSGMWDSIYSGFHSMINDIIDIWDKLHFQTPSFKLPFPPHTSFPSVTIGVPYIPHLAEGGLITSTGLVYAHVGEVISPAPSAPNPSRTGPAIVIQQANFASELDVETFMRRAAWVVQTKAV